MKRAGFSAGNPSFVGDVGKGSVSIIAIQNIAAILRHKEIGKAVVIEISPHATEPVSGSRHACLFRNVGEGAVSVVVIERVADGNPAIVEIAPVHKINVLPAVAVEIGDANSRTKLLAINRYPFVALVVHKLDASGCGYICELDRSRSGILSVQNWSEDRAGGDQDKYEHSDD